MRRALLLLLAPAILAQESPVPPRPKGIDASTERAIRRGLEFLKQEQSKEGAWKSGGDMGRYPCTMTGLAGLALVASGSTPSRGPYAREVRKAVDYLLRQSQPSGLITSPAEEGRSMYGHGFGLLFLSQVFGTEEDEKRQASMRHVIRRAIDLTCRSQSARGGWMYNPDDQGDEGSVTVTQVQALRGCRNAGFHVPKATIDRAIQYIEKSQEPDGGIAYSVDARGSRPAISAAACAVLYNAGAYDSKCAHRAFEYAWNNCRPSRSGEGHWFYTQLYMSQATWQSGDRYWFEYLKEIQGRVLPLQQGNGSWRDTDGVGPIYGSAIALLILQIPYNRLPILSR